MLQHLLLLRFVKHIFGAGSSSEVYLWLHPLFLANRSQHLAGLSNCLWGQVSAFYRRSEDHPSAWLEWLIELLKMSVAWWLRHSGFRRNEDELSNTPLCQIQFSIGLDLLAFLVLVPAFQPPVLFIISNNMVLVDFANHRTYPRKNSWKVKCWAFVWEGEINKPLWISFSKLRWSCIQRRRTNWRKVVMLVFLS